jgi:hypothetical protein
MSTVPTPIYPDVEIERLLGSLAGVISVRVVTNPLGRPEEIHILASAQLNPKQVVRNVESALSAGLGIVIDRRVVSVAQVRRDALEEAVAEAAAARQSTADQAEPAAGSVIGGEAEPESEARLVFAGYEAQSSAPGGSMCRVTLRRGEESFTGSGAGAATPQGRALAGARALFTALTSARADDGLALEGATLLEAHGRSYVLVAARALTGRHSRSLTGLAAMEASPEEAGVLASLQAANRWLGLP